MQRLLTSTTASALLPLVLAAASAGVRFDCFSDDAHIYITLASLIALSCLAAWLPSEFLLLSCCLAWLQPRRDAPAPELPGRWGDAALRNAGNGMLRSHHGMLRRRRIRRVQRRRRDVEQRRGRAGGLRAHGPQPFRDGFRGGVPASLGTGWGAGVRGGGVGAVCGLAALEAAGTRGRS